MLEAFDRQLIPTGSSDIYVARAGAGPPVLLLHGFLETHVMWHRVAPRLADRHTVVCADLRGYGSSSKEPSTLDHRPYSKTEVAVDMIRVMEELGFERFAVAGHGPSASETTSTSARPVGPTTAGTGVRRHPAPDESVLEVEPFKVQVTFAPARLHLPSAAGMAISPRHRPGTRSPPGPCP